MTHRNSARANLMLSPLLAVSALVRARRIALISLVLVLLITNGGAG